MKNYKPRAIIYTRVSSEKQIDNTSLKQQEEICRDYCLLNDYEIVKIFVEKGESAKYLDRTELQKALLFCGTKKNAVDFFLVYKFDRFSRDVKNHITIKAILSKYNVSLISATEKVEDTPAGRFLETVLAGSAQFENELRTERAVNGMKGKLSKGYWIYQAPFGYLKDMTSNQKPKPIIPHPEYFKPLQKAWQMYATGKFAMREIMEFLNREGVRTATGREIGERALSKFFRRQFYKGTIYSDSFGISVNGLHEPMIDEVTFQKVQDILRVNEERVDRTGKLDTNEDFLLSKILYCNSCGHMLTGCYSKGKRKYYGYYQCGNNKCQKRQYLPKDKMHEQFIKLLDELKTPKEDMDLFLDIITDEYDRLYQNAVNAQERIDTEIDEINVKIEKLKDLLEVGTYSESEYLERKKKYEVQIVDKKMNLNDTEMDIPELETCKSDAKRFLEHLPTFWINLSFKQKRKVNEFLFEDGLVWDGKVYRTPELHPVFGQISQVLKAEKTNVRPAGIEPTTSSLEARCSIH